jgi:hypothetical protein
MDIWGWARLSEPGHPPTWHKVRRVGNLGPDPRVRFDLACATGSIVDDRVPASSRRFEDTKCQERPSLKVRQERLVSESSP